jgi:hypothetical protein
LTPDAVSCPAASSEAGERRSALLQSTDRAGLTAAELAEINNQGAIASKLRLMAAKLARSEGEASTSGDSDSTATLQGTNRQLPNKEYSLYYRTQHIVSAEEWVRCTPFSAMW